jgi:hypothetical protein
LLFEHWQGMVDGLMGCQFCGQKLLLRLLDWRGHQLEQRIYSIGLVPSDVGDVFIADTRSDYCDLKRKDDELEALKNAAPATQLGLFHLPLMQCEKILPLSHKVRYPAWQQLEPGHPESQWWQLFSDLRNDPITD